MSHPPQPYCDCGCPPRATHVSYDESNGGSHANRIRVIGFIAHCGNPACPDAVGVCPTAEDALATATQYAPRT